MASSPDAVVYAMQNVGVTSAPSPVAVVYSLENGGFPLPVVLSVFKPQMAWGLAVSPPMTVSLLSLDAVATAASQQNVGAVGTPIPDAVVYNFEGDVTA